MFNMGNVPHTGGKFDPHPLWVKIPWNSNTDKSFRVIRDEVTVATKAANWNVSRGWQKRAVDAYNEWFADHQDPVKLYRASAYLGAASFTERGLGATKEFRKMDSTVNLGFSVLRAQNVPSSYEFCRRAYIVKAGDTHGHQFEDLAIRLLKQSPADRSVAIAMVREYQERKADSTFEGVMFDALFACAKTDAWLPWDDQWIAIAMCKYGRQHNSKSYYDKALIYVDRAIARTPKGMDAEPLRIMRKQIAKARDLPNFGYPKVG